MPTFQASFSSIIDQNAAVLTSPNLVSGDLGIRSGANLNTRVQVIEDVVLLEKSVSLIVEVDADLETKTMETERKRGDSQG